MSTMVWTKDSVMRDLLYVMLMFTIKFDVVKNALKRRFILAHEKPMRSENWGIRSKRKTRIEHVAILQNPPAMPDPGFHHQRRAL